MSALLLSLSTIAPGCALKAKGQAGAASVPAQQQEYVSREDSYERAKVERTEVPSAYFVKEGKPFCFMGSNNYYPIYKSDLAIRDVLDVAKAMNLGMLRIWSYLDRGSLDGSMPNIRTPGHKEGVYFQYWDPETNAPAYNDGPEGLQRLDFILLEARKRGISLTMVLTNNWRDFGGMDQYLTWYGLTKHHEFYTHPRVKAAYKGWVKHLVTRVNSIDGTPYIDDPAIFSWELTNEARAINYENFDSPEGWNTDTITRWADEMSTWIKSFDSNHMVSMGDEGFINSATDQVFQNSNQHDFYQASQGIDNEAITALKNIDYGTYHLYPDHWGTGPRWGNGWIEDHIEIGRRVDKPMVLEEYGIHIRRAEETSGPIVHGWERRELAYQNWNDIVLKRGGAASMFWILSGLESEGKLYPDYDHFTVYRDDQTFHLLKSYADRFPTEAAACALAQGADHGLASPFVSTRPAPKKDGAKNWPETPPGPTPPESSPSEDGQEERDPATTDEVSLSQRVLSRRPG